MRQSSRLGASLGLGGSLSTIGDNLTGALLALKWPGGKIWSLRSFKAVPRSRHGRRAAFRSGRDGDYRNIEELDRHGPGAASRARANARLGSQPRIPRRESGSQPDGRLRAALVFALAAVPVGVLWHALGMTAWSAGARRPRLVLAALGVALLVSLLAAVVTTNYTVVLPRLPQRVQPECVHTREVERALDPEGVPSRRVFLVSLPDWLDARNLVRLGDPDGTSSTTSSPVCRFLRRSATVEPCMALLAIDPACRGALARPSPPAASGGSCLRRGPRIRPVCRGSRALGAARRRGLGQCRRDLLRSDAARLPSALSRC